MKHRFWAYERERSKTWAANGSAWRFQASIHIHRHRYPTVSDRWVVQPSFIYDRKNRSVR